MADIRCLCERCKADYEQAGYTVKVQIPINRGHCDKCERNGVDVELLKLERHRKIVGVCSPFGGSEENLAKAREYCAQEVKAGNIPIAPHLIFTQFMSEETDRDKGISFGIELLSRLDELHVYCKPTSGMRREIETLSKKGMKIVYMEA